MPYFDRFDIAEAYYVYACAWDYTEYAQRIFTRLDRIKFKPRPSLSAATLTENGWDVYCALVRKRRGHTEVLANFESFPIEPTPLESLVF